MEENTVTTIGHYEIRSKIGEGGMIVIDDKEEKLHQLFEQVEYVGSSDNPYALERNVPVYICRGAKFGTLDDLWPKIKKWK